MADIDAAFRTSGICGVYPTQIDDELAWKIGNAAAQFLRTHLSGYDRGQTSANRLVVGRDMRDHSISLTESLAEGIVASGAGCADIGMVDTPMIYFAINHLGSCGGVQVSASHNPPQYNGFTICGLKARPIGANTGLKEIKHIVNTVRRMPPIDTVPEIQTIDLWDAYRQHVQTFLKMPRALKVVVDASNGMAGKMVPAVFDGSNIEIIPVNFEIADGFVHPPDPLVEANLQMTKDAVIKHGADLGVCFDGDADCCVFVDETGRTIGSDLMTALLARHFLAMNPGSVIVYDLRSSRVVAEEIRAAGGVPRRERGGHAFMRKALSDSRGVFGGEVDGHFYFRDNYNADSGAIALAVACSVLAADGATVSERIKPLRRYAASGEIRFEVTDIDDAMADMEKAFGDAEIDHLDGTTITYSDWWCNVRPSNDEPLLRLTLEAKNAKTMKAKLNSIKSILRDPVDQ